MNAKGNRFKDNANYLLLTGKGIVYKGFASISIINNTQIQNYLFLNPPATSYNSVTRFIIMQREMF